MKNYLSFGGGVNSVAMQLLMIAEGIEFESIFVNHGTDWPETYEYFNMFQDWLVKHGHKKITVLTPDMGTREGARFEKLYDYYFFKNLTPSKKYRSCTTIAKIRPIRKYAETPCFMMIGFASDESHRAKPAYEKGIENRWPLIEREISRQDCKDIIVRHGLPIPGRSGCFCCPFMQRGHVQELRQKHPNLFCKIEKLENRAVTKRGSVAYVHGVPVRAYIDEKQMPIFKQDEYPPCQCGL